jgi:hypothetical protein
LPCSAASSAGRSEIVSGAAAFAALASLLLGAAGLYTLAVATALAVHR